MWGKKHNNFVCVSESLLLTVLNWIDEQGVQATVIAPTHSAKWQPLIQAMEIDAIPLPPVKQSFTMGPSGHVEPWKIVGVKTVKTYRAVRVEGRNRPHWRKQ